MESVVLLTGFGSVCLLLGLPGIIGPRLRGREGPPAEGGCASVIVVVVGMTFLFWAAAGGAIKAAVPRVRDVVRPDGARLIGARVAPPAASPRGTTPSLVDTPVTIDDPAALASLAQVLAGARRWAPNHPQGRWACVVTLDYGDRHASFMAEATTNQGDLVTIWSRNDQGWNFGDYRADGLGQLLERLTAAAKRAPRHGEDPRHGAAAHRTRACPSAPEGGAQCVGAARWMTVSFAGARRPAR